MDFCHYYVNGIIEKRQRRLPPFSRQASEIAVWCLAYVEVSAQQSFYVLEGLLHPSDPGFWELSGAIKNSPVFELLAKEITTYYERCYKPSYPYEFQTSYPPG